jgi:outer membrane scaffolding protein for murein synthesis (MipA/OmpV family)
MARAADALPSTSPQAEAPPGWIATVGGTAVVAPRYPGAEKYGLSGLPSLSFRRAGTPLEFSAPDDGLDYTLYGTSTFKFGPVANLRPGRSAGIDARLSGLDNYHWTLEAGAFAEYWPVENVLRTRFELLHGLRGRDGVVANVSADLVQKFSAFTLSGGPRLALADGAVMESEFGVRPLAALRNGLVPPFDPHGGVKSAGYEIALSYDWSDQWRTTVFQRFDRLVGDAAASPITRRFGSPDQFTFGLGANYSFAVR